MNFGRPTNETKLRPELCSTPRPPTGVVPIPTPHPLHPAPRAPALGLCTLRLAEIIWQFGTAGGSATRVRRELHASSTNYRGSKTHERRFRKSKISNNFPATERDPRPTTGPTPGVGSLVPMVPLPELRARAGKIFKFFRFLERER